jgi:hypothetical protein
MAAAASCKEGLHITDAHMVYPEPWSGLSQNQIPEAATSSPYLGNGDFYEDWVDVSPFNAPAVLISMTFWQCNLEASLHLC